MRDNKIHDEKKLVSQLKKGEKEAFRFVYDLYKVKLYAYTYSFFRSREISEEIVHDVFVKIWQNRHQLNESLSFNSFIFTITKNLIIDTTRKAAVEQQYRKQLKIHQNTANYSLENEVIFAEYERIAQDAIEQLPHKRKLIFTLSRQNHLSYNQIASQLNISPKTVEVQMNKALKFIKEYLYTHTDITFTLFLFTLLHY